MLALNIFSILYACSDTSEPVQNVSNEPNSTVTPATERSKDVQKTDDVCPDEGADDICSLEGINTDGYCTDKGICEIVRLKKGIENDYFITPKQLAKPCAEKNTLFRCTLTNNKVVEVCDLGHIRYTFGPKDKPEIVLRVDRERIGFHCSTPGAGDDGSTLVIPFEDVDYTISHYWDLDEWAIDGTRPSPYLQSVQRDSNKTLFNAKCKDTFVGGPSTWQEITEPYCNIGLSE